MLVERLNMKIEHVSEELMCANVDAAIPPLLLETMLHICLAS